MKTWQLLLSLLGLLVSVSVLVGVGTWHMAYEEATLNGTIREQKAITTAKKWCREVINTILKQQKEEIKYIQKNCAKRKVNAGVLGLNVYGAHIVKEAVADVMRDNLSNYHFEVLSSIQSNKTLSDQAQELNQLSDVQVFIGPETESDLKQLLVWARTRPQPRPLIVFITTALLTDDANFDKHDADNHAVIQMTVPPSGTLQATLYQMHKRNIRAVLLLVSPDDHFTYSETHGYLPDVKIRPFISGKSTSATELLEGLEAEIRRIFTDDDESNVGILITKNYMFEQLLSEPFVGSMTFSKPWFTTVGEVLYDTRLMDLKLLKNQSIDLSYPLHVGNIFKNVEWHQNVSDRVKNNLVSNMSDSEYSSGMLEQIYDSVQIAFHIGSWLANTEVKLNTLARRISWESKMWAGMSGLLKIRETLKRSHYHYLDLQLTRNPSERVMEYPSGIWQVLSRIDTTNFH